jgi:glyoxylase-like metal-dependent hydrolase (beta-lactamase superfamily II)
VIFRQLVEEVSSTYTYLIGCADTRQAILIDPVLPTWERDLAEIRRLGLELTHTLDTHVHADHITGARKLREVAGSRIAHPALDRLPCTDVPIEEGRSLAVGRLHIDPLHTPGHTDNHFAYRLSDRVFTGDALLIDGCGRTDFQSGDARALYASVTGKLFTLPDETLVYPAHDYQGRRVSCIAQERARNPRLGGGKTLAEFSAIMAQLHLAYPAFIDHALPGNRQCGVCPPGVPDNLSKYCEQIAASPQG